MPSVTIAQASNPLFTLAIKESLSSVLSIPVTAITDIIIQSENRRILLSGVSLSYTINLISDKSADSYISTLSQSISSGSFSNNLSLQSGFIIGDIFGFQSVNFSPTARPSSAPSDSLVESKHGSGRVMKN